MSGLRRVPAYLGLTVLTAIIVFPLYYAVAGSLMTDRELTTFPPALFPSGVTMQNYVDVLDAIPLVRQYANSIGVALVVVAGVLLTSLLSAYAFVFLRFPFKRTLFALFLLTIMVPGESLIIPNYLTISNLGLLDTFPALTLPFIAMGFGTFLLRQFFAAFPREIYEAARMDGCTHLRFMFSILTPLSRPALAALAIYAFIATYNKYFWPLLVTRTPEMQTLQIGLSQLQSLEAREPGLILAGVTLAIIPMLILIYFFQRNIIRGLTTGSGK
ncbi:carbohydrate ABC transporter permease [Jiangella endophytica]|uniref:carbohydrate ABC transporter permease n=1 Tax=Jiangella endophytica TaxID=1623398 RepID=UPI000E34DDCD|nr:carbohydrate ABC transporter permease [Jiangella endophytica]